MQYNNTDSLYIHIYEQYRHWVISVRRFCLTLIGEARLWYETLGAAQLDWETLRDCFQQQYLKVGSTREQYFHAWRSFQFDEKY